MNDHAKTCEQTDALGAPGKGPYDPKKMNLQLFGNVNMDEVWYSETERLFQGPEDVEDESSAPEGAEDDTDTEEDEDTDPVYIPRLSVVGQNLPHTAIGEVVVRNPDGELYEVAVDKDGTVSESAFQIGADNIEDGSITGDKLEENTITSRELDMDEIFSETMLLNEMMAANIDAEALFENEAFQELFDERVAETATLRSGDAMTGPLALSGDPTEAMDAATKQYVDAAISGEMPGNAATATKLRNARAIETSGDVVGTATEFDGSANITIPTTLTNTGVTAGTYTKLSVDAKGRATIGAQATKADVGLGNVDNTTDSEKMVASAARLTTPRRINGVSFDGTTDITLSMTATSADTAAKLQTARTINGTAFDGTADIETARWGTARTMTVGSTGKSVNGSANVTWTLSDIGAASSSHTHSASSIGAAASSHTHSADNITSGTLTVAQGGTGATTALAARTSLGIASGVYYVSAAPQTNTAFTITFPTAFTKVPKIVCQNGYNATTTNSTTINIDYASASASKFSGNVIKQSTQTQTIPINWIAILSD